MKSDIFVVIPAYNEERTVGEVVHGCQVSGVRCQVLVVDDGSSDHTADVAHAAGALVLRHPINRGLGAALATGIAATLQCQADSRQPTAYSQPLAISGKPLAVIVTLDADLQHEPAEIPRLIEPIVRGQADFVIGSRFAPHPSSPHKWGRSEEGGKTVPFARRIANLFGNFFTWLLFGVWVSDSQSGFRAFRAEAAERMRLRTSTMEVSSEIIREIARLKLRLKEVPVTARYTPYSLAKGQGFFRGLQTLWKLIMLRFFR